MTGGRASIARHAACLTASGAARLNSRAQSTDTSGADAMSPAHPEGPCRHGAIEVGFEA